MKKQPERKGRKKDQIGKRKCGREREMGKKNERRKNGQ